MIFIMVAIFTYFAGRAIFRIQVLAAQLVAFGISSACGIVAQALGSNFGEGTQMAIALGFIVIGGMLVPALPEDSVTVDNKVYVRLRGESGEAFCGVCRRVDSVNRLYQCKATDEYRHLDCTPAGATMSKIPQSVLLGFPSFIAFILGAELFETRGSTSIREVLAGSLALILYQAICQWFIARKGTLGLRACWPTMLAMNVPLLVVVLISVVAEKSSVVWSQGVPMVLSGFIGTLIGAVVATWNGEQARGQRARG